MAALRPVAWSAVVGAAFAVIIAVPAAADPIGVPDPGSRPAPSGQLRLPGAGGPSTPVVPAVPGPLAAQVMAAETEVSSLGERLKGVDGQLFTARAVTADLERQWLAATEHLRKLREEAAAVAERAYKNAAELDMFRSFGSDLRDLGRLAPRDEPRATQVTPWDITRAEEQESTTRRAYENARTTEQGLITQRANLNLTYVQKVAALDRLRLDNATQLGRIEAEREAFERSQAGTYGRAGINIDGRAANPKAIRALQFALAQLGKPYEWGAEGPNRYDCSGLLWAAYRSVGVTLQRVANDQYNSTSNMAVPVDKLLPGDMLFFATNRSDWRSIHHAGMYIGNGKMVHAPTTGDVVKISTVWWSRFYGATRVFPAVAVPAPTPAPPTTPPPTQPAPTTPPPTTRPPSTPPPTTRPPSTPPPTTPPPTTPPPSTPPPTTPPPSPSPGQSPSSSPSATASASASAGGSGSP